MKDTDCVHFLQWALPQLRMRWSGFRKVRKQVCKRVARRMDELGLTDIGAYQQHLTQHPDEWQRLDSLCHVSVTRFYRDQRVFAELEESILPKLAATALAGGRKILNAWSIGSASGEEAYTLAILWHRRLAPRFADLQLCISVSEVDTPL